MFHDLGIAAICKTVTSPISIICYACSLIEYWASLSLDDDKDQLVAGANTMLKIAL
jgi:hypothetical protein